MNDEPTLSRRQALGLGAVAALAPVATAVAAQQPMATTAPAGVQALPYVDGLVPGAPGPGDVVPAYGAPIAHAKLQPMKVTRRPLGPADVAVDVLYTGICHSDIHFVNNDWSNTVYPCVPGHEIAGRVAAVGADVTTLAVGDTVAVGPIVGHCGQCASCKEGVEQYCAGPQGRVEIYNGPSKPDGTNTYGGYSTRVVVGAPYAFKVPAGLDLKGVPPLMCAGVTVYSPLKHYKAGPGKKVGVAGLGGLGHVAVKLAAALGAEVTVFSTSPEKEADARKFGARAFVLSKDPAAMARLEGTLDLVLITIPQPFDVNPYTKVLARDGTACTVGALQPLATPTDNKNLAVMRRATSGSILGSLAETRELLDLCGARKITSDVEVITIDKANDAYPKVRAGQVRYRYVIDVAGSRMG